MSEWPETLAACTGFGWDAGNIDKNWERPLKAYPAGSPAFNDPDPVPEYWHLYSGNFGMEVNIERKSGPDEYDWYRYSPRREYNMTENPELPPEDWTPSIHESGYSIDMVSGGPNDEVWYLVETSICLQHGYLINAWFNRMEPFPENPLEPDTD